MQEFEKGGANSQLGGSGGMPPPGFFGYLDPLYSDFGAISQNSGAIMIEATR